MSIIGPNSDNLRSGLMIIELNWVAMHTCTYHTTFTKYTCAMHIWLVFNNNYMNTMEEYALIQISGNNQQCDWFIRGSLFTKQQAI